MVLEPCDSIVTKFAAVLFAGRHDGNIAAVIKVKVFAGCCYFFGKPGTGVGNTCTFVCSSVCNGCIEDLVKSVGLSNDRVGNSDGALGGCVCAISIAAALGRCGCADAHGHGQSHCKNYCQKLLHSFHCCVSFLGGIISYVSLYTSLLPQPRSARRRPA